MSSIQNQQFSSDALGYYEVLKVGNYASSQEIKQNYRDFAKVWHPDHNTSDEAKENFQKISVAYDILKDDNSRLMYDILCIAYPRDKFPDMFNLKIYKNQKGMEDLDIRAISCWRVIGKINTFKSTKSAEICNPKEALDLLLKVSTLNWLTGWWSVKSFKDNINALKYNYYSINQNGQENITLLLHNAVAYYQENKLEKSYFSAEQALDYADDNQKQLIHKWMYMLGVNVRRDHDNWNYSILRMIQFVVPVIFLLIFGASFSGDVMTNAEFLKADANKKEITYYQEVKFRSGGRTVDDVVVAKIINIPVDSDDRSKLFYVTKELNVMHGPDDDFDVMKKLKSRTTVRVTGVSPDEVWYRVMLDNGDMGFVRKEFLKQGIGRDIPEDSKIYTGTR